MTRIFQILISIILIFFTFNIYSQSIIAGVTPTNGTFIDIIPDTTLISFQNFTNLQFDFDINNDSYPDFQIYTDNHGGLGGGSSRIGIKAYDSNEIAYSHIDTCFAGPFNFPVSTMQMAKAYNNNDTISMSELWTKDDCSLNYENHGVYWDSIGNGYSYGCNFANFTSPSKFIGLRTISNDTIYGWVQVKDITTSEATIQAYASTHFSTGISEDINPVPIKVYPNPCEQILNISLHSPLHYSGTIGIYNDIGILELQEVFMENKKEINVQNLQNGMYIIILKIQDEVFRIRFQKID